MPSFEYGIDNKAKPVIDPHTGARIYRMTDASENGTQRSFAFVKQVSSGWINPSNLLSDSTSTLASISGSTSYAFLAFDGTESYNAIGGFAPQWYAASNIDVRLNGYGSDASSANRQVNACISLDSGQTCYSSTITVTLPQSTASAQWINASFPASGFAGWNKSLKRNDWAHGLFQDGVLNATSGSVTLSSVPGNANYAARTFNFDWAAGSKIHIVGSSPTCTDNLCTIASVTSRSGLTLVESLTISNATWTSQNLGVKVWKTNTTGSVNLSAGYKLAMQYELQVSPEESCSPNTVTTTVDTAGSPLGYSLVGRLCKFRDYGMGQVERLYFVSDSTPDVRLLSLFRVPTSIAGHSSGDLPNDGSFSKVVPSVFDKTEGNVMWTAYNTPNGKAIFKLTYSGNYASMTNWLWQSSGVIGSADNQVTWLNTTKGGSSLNTQVAALPEWDAAVWGSPNLDFRGITTTGKAIFISLNIGQNYAGWVFSFDLATSTLERAFNTLNSSPELTAGGIHGISVADVVALPIHTQTKNNAAKNFGGPFTATVTHVKKSGSWSTDTSINYYTTANYDAACPSDIDQKFKDRGAVGSNCVQIKLANEPCSAIATAAEKAKYPCPGDATKSYVGVALRPGNVLLDLKGTDAIDDESLMVVKVTGALEYTLLRDQYNGYACSLNTPRQRVFNTGKSACLAENYQISHANGWTATLIPSARDYFWDPVTNALMDGSGTLMRGHYDVQQRPAEKHSAIGIGSGPQAYWSVIDQILSDYGNTQTPIWFTYNAGNFAGLGSSDVSSWLQSYAKVPGSVATGTMSVIGSDMRHINSQFGDSAEVPSQTVGASRTVTLVGGTSNVYKVSAISGTVNRKRPLWVWAGETVLQEKSSAATGNTLTDADTNKFCYALRATECRSDSSAGDLYMVVPKLNTSASQCWASNATNRVACAWSSTGAMSRVVQMRLDRNDNDGIGQRAISMALSKPQQQYVYQSARSYPTGNRILTIGQMLDGWYTGPIMIEPGRWPDDSIDRTNYYPVTVSTGSNIVVEFGYGDYGSSTDFFCTPRVEKCVASANTINSTTPFKFAGESGAYTPSSSAVVIPALPGRVLYYRIVKSGVPGDVQVMPIP